MYIAALWSLFVVHVFVDSRQVIRRLFKIQWHVCEQSTCLRVCLVESWPKQFYLPKKKRSAPINSGQLSSEQILITLIYPGKNWRTFRRCFFFLLILSAHCSVLFGCSLKLYYFTKAYVATVDDGINWVYKRCLTMWLGITTNGRC